MTNCTYIEGKHYFEAHVSSATPPDGLDVRISLSAKVIGHVLRDKLKRLAFYKPRWERKRDSRKKNQKPRLRRLLRRELLSSQYLVDLRFIITGCQESFWHKFGRAFHFLPAIETLGLADYSTTDIPPGFFYYLMMIPKNLKILSLTTDFDPYLGAACFSRRTCHCLYLGVLEIYPNSLAVFSRSLILLLRRTGVKNRIIHQIKLKYPRSMSFVEGCIADSCLKLLPVSIAFQGNGPLRTTACIV